MFLEAVIINKFKHWENLQYLLSYEYNCTPTAFKRNENVLTLSVPNEKGRYCTQDGYYFHMATMGGNAVVTAAKELHPFLKEWIKDKQGCHLFDIPNLVILEKELNTHGYTLTETYHMFLSTEHKELKKNYPVKWFYDKEIVKFYGDKRFPNAICDKYYENRPDRIVVCAYDDDKIMGMAGCSEDAMHWQQIGIDVMPEYRSKGVGAYLVTLLKNAIEQQRDIPFYGTDIANYHSWNIALNSGFRPAWVEIGVNKMK